LEPPTELPDAWLGAVVDDKSGRPVIAAVESRSPAAAVGLKAGDVVSAVDGATVDTAAAFDRAITAKGAGIVVPLAIGSGDQAQTRIVSVTLAHKLARSFKIRPMAQLTPLQSAILKDWTAPNAK
jgi:S1-C subfamily serine protease